MRALHALLSPVYGRYHTWITKQPCQLRDHEAHRCHGPRTGHHVKHIASGGQDYGNEIPLCLAAHTGPAGVHRIGRKTFEARYGLDLKATALEYAKLWDNLSSAAA